MTIIFYPLLMYLASGNPAQTPSPAAWLACPDRARACNQESLVYSGVFGGSTRKLLRRHPNARQGIKHAPPNLVRRHLGTRHARTLHMIDFNSCHLVLLGSRVYNTHKSENISKSRTVSNPTFTQHKTLDSVKHLCAIPKQISLRQVIHCKRSPHELHFISSPPN